MNIVAKLRRIAADVEESKARLDALEQQIFPQNFAHEPWYLKEARRQADESLPAPIYEPDPIVSATLAPTPRKRGRPPKPKS